MTQPRQPAGRPTGGEFSAKDRAEAGVGLNAPTPHLDRVEAVLRAARHIELEAVRDTLADHVRETQPDATGAVLSLSAHGDWGFVSAYGSDGPLTHEEGVFFTDDPGLYRVSNQFDQNLRKRLRGTDDLVELGFGRHVDGDAKGTRRVAVDFDTGLDPATIEARVVDLFSLGSEGNQAAEGLRIKQVAHAAREGFPDAVAVIADEGWSGDTPFTALDRIIDADENVLWSAADDDYTPEATEIERYLLAIDPNSLKSDGEGEFRITVRES